MTPLFKKLNLKAQTNIVVLNAPASFEPELAALADITITRKLKANSKVQFALAFVITQAELDQCSHALAQAADGDAVLWFVYPKGSSKKYRCEFNRDQGWDVLGAQGFEGVRMVAIDEDWSALRFRRVEHVKTMQREPTRASSAMGKARTQGNTTVSKVASKKAVAKS